MMRRRVDGWIRSHLIRESPWVGERASRLLLSSLRSRPVPTSRVSTLQHHVLCVVPEARRQHLSQQQQQHREQSTIRFTGNRNSRIPNSLSTSAICSPLNGVSRFQQLHQQQLQRRTLWTSLPTWINDITATVPFWGHSAALLKTIHMDGTIPYWACFPLLNVLLRVCLFPLVIHSAHVGIRFSKVAPDIQLLFAVYARDYQRLVQSSSSSLGERMLLARQTFRTMSSLLKYNQVNPLTFFYAPLIQIPVYYYCANDLRRVVRGSDPDMAQALTDAPVSFWIPNLTEADPWNVLPSLAGVLFYVNLEMSLRAKPGERQTYLILLIKDVLQSVAVLTPAFLGSAPAGMQLYAVTTFVITGLQSALVKNNTFRPWVGLPLLTAPVQDEAVAEIQRRRDEDAKQQVVGKGVVRPGTAANVAKWTTQVKSSIPGSAEAAKQAREALTTTPLIAMSHPDEMPFIHGISAPREFGRAASLSFVKVVPDSATSSNDKDASLARVYDPEDTTSAAHAVRKEKKDLPKRKKRRSSTMIK